MNELKVISLNGCPFSMAAVELIESIKNTPSSKINIKIVNVSQEEKSNYKNDMIDTFPQVYFNDTLIGGYDSFNELYLSIKGETSLDEMINIIKTKTKIKERKGMLRFIKFLINK